MATSEALRFQQGVEQVEEEQEGDTSCKHQFHNQSLSQAFVRPHIAAKNNSAIRM
jgi:hypothetical protein